MNFLFLFYYVNCVIPILSIQTPDVILYGIFSLRRCVCVCLCVCVKHLILYLLYIPSRSCCLLSSQAHLFQASSLDSVIKSLDTLLGLSFHHKCSCCLFWSINGTWRLYMSDGSETSTVLMPISFTFSIYLGS